MLNKLLIYHVYHLSQPCLPAPLPQETVAPQGRTVCVLFTLRTPVPGKAQHAPSDPFIFVTRMDGRALAWCLDRVSDEGQAGKGKAAEVAQVGWRPAGGCSHLARRPLMAVPGEFGLEAASPNFLREAGNLEFYMKSPGF